MNKTVLLAGVSALAIGLSLAAVERAVAAPQAIPSGGVLTPGSTGYLNSITVPNVSNATTVAPSSSSTALINSGTIGTLTNSGTFTSTIGVLNTSTGSIGTINNAAAGLISSTAGDALISQGRIGTLSNSGTISGGTGGILLDVGGTIGQMTNTANATISGAEYGIQTNAGSKIGTLTNDGLIVGTSITGSIIAGVSNGGIIGLFNNSGTVLGQEGYGIIDSGSIGTLVNSGQITGQWFTGVQVAAGSIGTLSNSGTISGADAGVSLSTIGSTITSIINSGLISGGSTGIANIGGTIGSLNNTGIINGGEGAAVYNSNNGFIGTIVNSGLLTGFYGINNVSSSISNINNSGTIQGTEVGILNDAGTIGTLTNSGLINDGQVGIVNSGRISTLINTGSIIGTDNGVVASGTASNIGILRNSGTISGGQYGFISSGTLGTLINSGLVSSTYDSAVEVNTGTVGIIINSGSFSNTDGSGLLIRTNTSVTSAVNSGVISGGVEGVFNEGTLSSLSNTGIITGGEGAAIYNYSGTIGQIVNSGLMRAFYGIKNTGTNGHISSIVNSGTILGTINAGLYNASTGTIGGVTNSGLISGVTAAIKNLGTLGPVTNSGTVAGKILNTSSSGLTINGGSSRFGLLTGTGGTVGSIISETADVTMVSGNQILNDDVDVAGHSFKVLGGTLRLNNTVSITGDFQQSNSSLILTAASASDYAYLSVDGNATVTNTGVTISGAGLTKGETFTIVRPIGTGTYTGDTGAVAVTPGLTAVVTSTGANGTTGNDLVLTLVTNSTGYTHLVQSNAEPTFQSLNATDLAGIGAVEQHQETEMAYNPDGTGAAAGSDAEESAVWGQMLDGSVTRDAQSDSPGYHLNDYGMMFGADHRFNRNIMGGAAVSWIRAWSTGDGAGAGSSSELNSYQLTFYGTYRLDRLFVDGQTGIGYNHYSQTTQSPLLPLSASYGGVQGFGKATVGYDFPVHGMTVTPMAGLRWVHAVNDSYTATGGGGSTLNVNSQTLDAVSHDIGAKVSWTMPFWSGNVKTDVRAAWEHDYVQGPITTTGNINGDTPFSTASERTAPDGALIDLAATYNSATNISVRAEYTGDLREGFQSHTGFLKVLWGF